MSEKRRRICPFCEATCGLVLTIDGRKVTRVEGDADDPFSEGFICPKGAALAQFDADPDRLRTPLIREGTTWREAAWDEAFEHIDANLNRIVEEHDKHALAAYVGNPVVHNLSLLLYNSVLLRALGSPNIFSATSVDQLPKQLVCAALFGTGLSVPIPDIDRTDYLLILGANPVESNGSLLTAPNIGDRLKRLRKRGGKLIVIDPRRTKTARLADAHHFIRPGTDAHFLFALVHTIFEEDLANLGRLEEHVMQLDQVRELCAPFTPEAAAGRCGIPAETIRQIARDLATSPTAAVYGRIGTCTQAFGTLASWLVEVIHVLTGNLDREGGALFTLPAHGPGNTKGKPGSGRGLRMGRRSSRVRNHPEIFGEFPVACLAEEIDTPGERQVRALITVAGNPVLSTPNSDRLDRALASLEFMVSVDVYLNETTRHANVILPGVSSLEGSHYDPAFEAFAIHNYARYSPALFEIPEGQMDEWEILLRLTGILSGAGPQSDITFFDDLVISTLIQRETSAETSCIHGRESDEILEALKPRRGPDRMLDFMLRTGPYGEGFGANPDGLTLDKVAAAPTGIDLGPLKPRLPEVLRTVSGKVELAPDIVTEDIDRLVEDLTADDNGLLLIGRRDLSSNNSWMHNLPTLVAGHARCTLQIHPDTAAACGVADGEEAAVTSRVGTVCAPVTVTDAIAPGVVSLPHGWGHDHDDLRLSVAREHAGVNSNILTDEDLMDVPSGNAVLCGIPVTVGPA